jgi:general secretion pathway protein A
MDALMYESFYGLRERPFDLTPNPRFLLLTGRHREALSNLHYGLMSRCSLTLLIGDAGTGKTTLIRAAIAELEKQGALIGYLNNPTLTRQEFYEFLSGAFGLEPSATGSKVRLLKELAGVLERRRSSDMLTGLVIDEAQSLPDHLLEEVRLLANIETVTEKLLPVVLAGQPELADRLNRPSLRQLKQRVALRCTLGALDVRETAEYIAARIRAAGGNGAVVFTRQAVEAIHEHSGGIPRLISVICGNAMISGFAADRRPVSRDIVDDVCRDFDLPGRKNGKSPHQAEATPAPTVVNGAPAGDNGRHTVRNLFEHFSVRRRFSFF